MSDIIEEAERITREAGGDEDDPVWFAEAWTDADPFPLYRGDQIRVGRLTLTRRDDGVVEIAGWPG